MKKRTVRALSVFLALLLVALSAPLPAAAASATAAQSCPHAHLKLIESVEWYVTTENTHTFYHGKIYECTDCLEDGILIIDYVGDAVSHNFTLIGKRNSHVLGTAVHYYDDVYKCFACKMEFIDREKAICPGPPCPEQYE